MWCEAPSRPRTTLTHYRGQAVRYNHAPRMQAALVALAAAGLMLGCSEPGANGRTPLPAGLSESDVRVFRLNDYTRSDQRWPEIAISDDGRTIAAGWASHGQFGDGWNVIARRFDPLGKSLGSEFALDDFRKGAWPNAEDPSLDFDRRGNLAVAWHSENTDEDDGGWTIFERRYRPDGSAFGPGRRVPTQTKFDQWRPTVMVASNGATLVTWYSERPGSGGDNVSEIKGRALDGRDEFVSDEFLISGAGDERRLQWRQGAVNRSGQFTSFWYVEKPSMTGFVRLLDPRGAARSPELTFPDFPNAGVRGNGDTLVSFGGKGQWLSPAGQALGSMLSIRVGEIAMNDEGAFVVIAVNQGPRGHGLYGYPYDRDGRAIPDPIYLSPGHDGFGGPPHVDISQNGVIAATWEEVGGADGDGTSVWAAVAVHPSYRRLPSK
ncbi:MAG: hypothetical protein HYS05_16850 [Acidobacteria bacterium]|nr:hypothetical protein [Acidobacteriota bacterium]